MATAEVSQMKWPVESSAIGTITPVQGVTLSFGSSGTVATLAFSSGQVVVQGDVLATLDASSERARLAAAEAAFDLAKLRFERSERLLSKKTISQAEYDGTEAEYRQAAANVRSLEADISKKQVVAPFDGRLGIRRINLGQYLNAGDSVVSLQSIDPVHVTFHLPQKDVSYLKVGLPVVTSSDAFPGQKWTGEVFAINSELDPQTRMIEIQALLPNAAGRLSIGMFVNVRMERSRPREIHAVPASSVVYASYGNSIYTVMPSEESESYIARQRFVKLGERRGDFVEVLEGLDPNERVVTGGAFKLYPGAAVVMNDDQAPAFELNPNPKDS